jgi:hypothetical protein
MTLQLCNRTREPLTNSITPSVDQKMKNLPSPAYVTGGICIDCYQRNQIPAKVRPETINNKCGRRVCQCATDDTPPAAIPWKQLAIIFARGSSSLGSVLLSIHWKEKKGVQSTAAWNFSFHFSSGSGNRAAMTQKNSIPS